MFILTILAKLHQWQRRRAARVALHELSDRELRDIGLNRTLIEAAVRGDVHRERGA